MFYLIDVDLGDAEDISVKGLKIGKKDERVYLEAFTSILTVGKESLVNIKLLSNEIHFTSEIGNGTLGFLDLQITLTNNKLEYKIFRKPTFTDTVILFISNHPMNTKLSAFYSMFNRLIRTPMNTTNFNSELNIIYTMGKKQWT